MRELPRWQQVPGLYRLLVILFAAIDVIILAIVAAGLRSWFHGVGSVVQSAVYLLFLAAFFVHTPPSEPLARSQPCAGTARIWAGWSIRFPSGRLVLGGVGEAVGGCASGGLS